MKPVRLADVPSGLNVLYYGDAGTGKTTDAAAMANLGRILVINAEGGLHTGPLRANGIDVDSIDVWPGPDTELSFETLDELTRHLVKDSRKPNPTYVGGVWDSLTDIHQTLLEHAVAAGFVKATAAGKDRERFFIDRDDYGTMTEQVRLLCRRWRDMPMHWAVTCLSRRDKDGQGRIVYQPAVTPALQTAVTGWMDMVGATSVAAVGDVEEYRALFRPIKLYRGKDRFKVLPRYLFDPHFDRLVAYRDGELTPETDPVMAEARARHAAFANVVDNDGDEKTTPTESEEDGDEPSKED